jgi:hypothetical protein
LTFFTVAALTGQQRHIRTISALISPLVYIIYAMEEGEAAERASTRENWLGRSAVDAV